jgi:hypothetical protein
MATLESMAIRSNAACKRIEARLNALGVESEPLPRSHQDRDMLRTIQLEQIADALESIELPQAVAPVQSRNPPRVKVAGKRKA